MSGNASGVSQRLGADNSGGEVGALGRTVPGDCGVKELAALRHAKARQERQEKKGALGHAQGKGQ